LVVCVEAGLDAAMRRCADEMSRPRQGHLRGVLLANFSCRWAARGEVLHDLGVRTGVDDVRRAAAI
jgi:tight adherence protein C